MNILESGYYNPTHGLELFTGNTTGFRGNENGILFLAEYIILKDMKGEDISQYKDEVNRLIKSMEVEPGLFDRGSQDRQIDYRFRRTISLDNISAICFLSKIYDLPYAKDIYEYGLKHGFVYNNVQPRWRAPVNPGNYPVWAKMGDSSVFHFIFLWLMTINFFITLSKPKEDTSSKLLNLVELYSLRNEPIYSAFWKKYVHAMESMYGTYWISAMMNEYFKDPEHPNNIESRGLKYEDKN